MRYDFKMKNVLNQKAYLAVLKSTQPKTRQFILENADRPLVRALVEIVVNLLKGNIPSTPSQRNRLRCYKHRLRRIYRTCFNQKCHKIKVKNGYFPILRRKVVQIGGALPFIIPLLAPLIGKAALGGAVAATSGHIAKKLLSS